MTWSEYLRDIYSLADILSRKVGTCQAVTGLLPDGLIPGFVVSSQIKAPYLEGPAVAGEIQSGNQVLVIAGYLGCPEDTASIAFYRRTTTLAALYVPAQSSFRPDIYLKELGSPPEYPY